MVNKSRRLISLSQEIDSKLDLEPNASALIETLLAHHYMAKEFTTEQLTALKELETKAKEIVPHATIRLR